MKDVFAMTQSEPRNDPEHQRLVAQCHSLVDVIANRPGAVKLLKGVLPTLEQYAAYKMNRSRLINKY